MGTVKSIFIMAGLLVSVSMAAAESVKVKILDRENNETEYTYLKPGWTNDFGGVQENCSGSFAAFDCSSSSGGLSLYQPPEQIFHKVRGATLSLLLPDGRIAVVNCESKFAQRFAGPQGNKRSCRVPLVDSIQAEFNGDKAKLKWPTSIDGKKIESETYKILAVFEKPVAKQ